MLFFIGLLLLLGGVGTMDTTHNFTGGLLVAVAGLLCMFIHLLINGGD